MGDLQFSVYADFETAAPNCDYTCPENNTMSDNTILRSSFCLASEVESS